MEVHNIIFDLGGVLLNINYQLTIHAFEKLGICDFGKKFSQAQQSHLFDDLETGKTGEKEFFESIRNIAGQPIEDKVIEGAWNAMLQDFPGNRLALLKKVKQHYRSFLLSNTNIIHLNKFNEILNLQHGYKTLEPYFEEVFFSHEIGYRKPNTEAFDLILKKHDLIAPQTLFIDDTEQHVKGARKAGLLAHHLKNNDIEEIFEDNGRLLPGFLAKLHQNTIG